MIDAYLSRYGKKRYDVYKTTGLSQQTLASANGKRASALTVRIVQAIAQTVGQPAGAVLEEMLAMEREDVCVMIVTTKEDLWEALKRQEGRILVQGELCVEVYDLARKMYRPGYNGLQAGTAVMNQFTLPLMEKAINKVLALVRRDSDEQKQALKIADKLRHYSLYLENGDVLLVLGQLEQ